ncbi:hypothetical protein, partial [Corynebacterium variabile]|uniref:hypothetical protein n=1 Tax=Corynebacterium variabile TaxID=1727 RepID=UPI003F93F47D
TPDPHTASVVRYQLRHSPGRDAVRKDSAANGLKSTGHRQEPANLQVVRPALWRSVGGVAGEAS